MSSIMRITVVMSVLTFAVSSACNAASPKAEEIFQRIIANRRSLDSGEFTVKTTESVISQTDNWSSRSNSYHFLFDEGNRRIDISVSGIGRTTGKPSHGEQKIIFRDDGTFISSPLGLDTSVQIGNDRRQSNVDGVDIDARAVGLVPCAFDMLYKYGLSDAFTLFNHGPTEVEEITDEATQHHLLRVSSRFPSTSGKPIICELVVDQDAGFSLLSAATTRPDFSYHLNVSCKEWVPGIWFPESGVYEHYKYPNEQKTIARREIFVIEDVQFPADVSAQHFEVTGIDLRPGRPVRDTTSGKDAYSMWDGKQLVAYPTEFPRSNRSLKSASLTSRTTLLLLNAIVLALIAGGTAWWYFRTRNA